MNQARQARLQGIIGSLANTDDPDKKKTAEQLMQTIGQANDVLATAGTVFPLTIFPDTISVDRTKISITQRNFFMSGETISIRIEDILNVAAVAGPFFGSVRISTRFFNPEKPYTVRNLWRKDALKLKRIIQGYLIARQNKIDTTSLETKELAQMLDELGMVPTEEKL